MLHKAVCSQLSHVCYYIAPLSSPRGRHLLSEVFGGRFFVLAKLRSQVFWVPDKCLIHKTSLQEQAPVAAEREREHIQNRHAIFPVSLPGLCVICKSRGYHPPRPSGPFSSSNVTLHTLPPQHSRSTGHIWHLPPTQTVSLCIRLAIISSLLLLLFGFNQQFESRFYKWLFPKYLVPQYTVIAGICQPALRCRVFTKGFHM